MHDRGDPYALISRHHVLLCVEQYTYQSCDFSGIAESLRLLIDERALSLLFSTLLCQHRIAA